MLQSIRSRITGVTAWVILLLIGLTFMFFGINSGNSIGDWAAKVNGEKVPMQNFRSQLQRVEAQYSQYYPDGIPDEMRTQLRENVLNGLVRNELISQRVFDERYRVSNKMVADTLRAVPSFQLNGEFDRAVYKQQLQIAGMTEAGWEAQTRRQLEVGQFRDALSNSAFVTPAELERRQQLENEERVISYAIVPAAKFKAEVSVSDADIAAEYEATKDKLITEQEVDIEYIELKTEDLAKEITIEPTEIENYYLTIQSRFGEPEQRSARHILIESDASNDAEKKAIAEDLLAQLKAGADFAELAKEKSDDIGSGAQGGDLGFFDQTRMVPEFTQATWALEKGALSEPVKTQFGYHIIQLQDIQASTVPALAELAADKRAEVEQEYRLSKVGSLLNDKADELEQQVLEASDVLENVAELNGLELKTQKNINRNTYTGLAAEPAVKSAVFTEELINGTNSNMIAVNNDHAVFLRVTDFREPRQKTLDEVTASIRTQLEQKAAAAKAVEVGTLLQSEVASPTELKTKADAAGYAYVADANIRRNQPGVQRDILTAAFQATAPEGAPVEQGVDLGNGDYAIFYLQEVKKAGADLTEAEKEAMFAAAASQIGGIELNAYLNNLREDAMVVFPESIDE